jgi:CheY-like chemotaxis protein
MTSPAPLPEAVAEPRRSLRVLYADDMQQLRELITIVLGRDGHSVTGVPNGELALAKVKADLAAFDVLITDHHMPGMNGLELVSALRETAYPGRILVFSSEISETVDSAYRRLKVDHVLPKPIFPAQLRAIFAKL